MSEILRTFIAVEVPDNVKETVKSLQQELRPFKCRVSWTKPHTVHLSLKFLGNTDIESVKLIGEALSESLRGIQPFELEIEKTGVFGGKRPRVMWIGLKDNKILTQVNARIESAVGKFGYPKEERKYHPHLTIGRVKDPRGTLKMMEHFKSIRLPAQKFIAKEVVFFKSELNPIGAVHTPLKRIGFA